MKNKKILFIYDFPLWGNGSATFMRELIKFLLRMGYEIAVVAPDDRQFSKKVKVFTARPKVTPVFVGHPELPSSPKYSQLTSQELRRINNAFARASLKAIKSFKPDVIHVNHCMLISWAGKIASSLSGVKYLISCHGSDLHTIEKDRRLFYLTQDAIKDAQFITTNSRPTRDWFIKLFGEQYRKKLKTITIGIDLNIFPKAFRVKRIENKYNLKNKNVILFVGRLTPQKGVKYLIQAANKIDGEVFIIGDGPQKNKLEKLAKQLKLTNVHFLGYFSKDDAIEFKSFYYIADVVVVPSTWEEPLGLVVLEAMACQTPVVATNKGGMKKLINDGVNGYLVRAKSSKDIADKVNKILANPDKAKKMGVAARKMVKERFDWKKIAVYFHKLYQNMPEPRHYFEPKSVLHKLTAKGKKKT